ncbi:unnamed protein product [Victoria cruziana]
MEAAFSSSWDLLAVDGFKEKKMKWRWVIRQGRTRSEGLIDAREGAGVIRDSPEARCTIGNVVGLYLLGVSCSSDICTGNV